MNLYVYRVTFESGESVVGHGQNMMAAICKAVTVHNAQTAAILAERNQIDAFHPINTDAILKCERVGNVTRRAA